MSSSIIKYFKYEDVQDGENFMYVLAKTIDDKLPECAEKSAGMRKLLEAHDCFLRAAKELSKEDIRKLFEEKHTAPGPGRESVSGE